MLRLHCNSFEMNIYSAWHNFQNEEDLSDVTLACDDNPNHHIQAHKIILSSFSPVFKSLVRLNPGQKPLLYLRGVKYHELVDIMNFIYKGEVNIIADGVNSFIALAQDLKIKGLSEEMTRNGQFLNNIKSPEKNTTSPSNQGANQNQKKVDTLSTKKESDWSVLKTDISNCDSNKVLCQQVFTPWKTTLSHQKKQCVTNDDEEIARLAWEATMLNEEDENDEDR